MIADLCPHAFIKQMHCEYWPMTESISGTFQNLRSSKTELKQNCIQNSNAAHSGHFHSCYSLNSVVASMDGSRAAR